MTSPDEGSLTRPGLSLVSHDPELASDWLGLSLVRSLH